MLLNLLKVFRGNLEGKLRIFFGFVCCSCTKFCDIFLRFHRYTIYTQLSCLPLNCCPRTLQRLRYPSRFTRIFYFLNSFLKEAPSRVEYTFSITDSFLNRWWKFSFGTTTISSLVLSDLFVSLFTVDLFTTFVVIRSRFFKT
jgi:hypothetical protein